MWWTYEQSEKLKENICVESYDFLSLFTHQFIMRFNHGQTTILLFIDFCVSDLSTDAWPSCMYFDDKSEIYAQPSRFLRITKRIFYSRLSYTFRCVLESFKYYKLQTRLQTNSISKQYICKFIIHKYNFKELLSHTFFVTLNKWSKMC